KGHGYMSDRSSPRRSRRRSNKDASRGSVSRKVSNRFSARTTSRDLTRRRGAVSSATCLRRGRDAFGTRWSRRWNPMACAVGAACDPGRVTRARVAAGLESIRGAAHGAGRDAEARRRVECYLFTEGTRRLRHALVEALEPDGLRVRGDEGWKANGRAVGAP